MILLLLEKGCQFEMTYSERVFLTFLIRCASTKPVNHCGMGWGGEVKTGRQDSKIE